MRLVCFVLLLIAGGSAGAEEVHFQLERSKSEVTFSGELGSVHAGGAFNDFNATLVLNGSDLTPVRLTYAANLSTVRFTEGGPREQLLLQAVAQTLPDALAHYSSTSIMKHGPRSFFSRGAVKAFRQEYEMKIPFTIEEASRTRVRLTGMMRDRGKVLPVTVPGLSGEFAGVVKFELLFTLLGGAK